MTLSDRLKQASRDVHNGIEALPLSQAIVAGRITRPRYDRLLAQLERVHGTLESLLPAATELIDLYDAPTMARVADVRRDRVALALPPGDDDTLMATAAFVGRLYGWAGDCPAALLGPLYVLEASRMGSMLLAGPLGRALGLCPAIGGGLDYHTRDLSQRVPQWRAFKARLDQLALSAAQEEAAVEAAAATFEALDEIYQALGDDAAGSREPAGLAAGATT